MRSGRLAGVIVALVIVTVGVRQQVQLSRLSERNTRLMAEYRELAETNAALLSIDVVRNDELEWLRQQTAEMHRLRRQLAEMRKQLENTTIVEGFEKENGDEFTGYITRKELRFAGFDTPQHAFRSLRWAAASGDYEQWLASLSPELQEEELADLESLKRFRDSSAEARIAGMQVLASKPLAPDRVELKVRLDTESSVLLLIYPMVLIGSEWRLGGEIVSYSQSWDVTDRR